RVRHAQRGEDLGVLDEEIRVVLQESRHVLGGESGVSHECVGPVGAEGSRASGQGPGRRPVCRYRPGPKRPT
ncbi:hypothetical protein HMPREF9991_02439, partial [Staphylococcus epidermidis NIHLM067]